MKHLLALLLVLVPLTLPRAADPPRIPPLPADILDAHEKKLGVAAVYPNYVEITTVAGAKRGSVGVVMAQGKALLFLVRADEDRHLIGWAEGHRLYNSEDQLVGYYFWTPIWSYVYDPEMKKVGQAQCLIYQGVCAAGVAGFLLGLL